MSFKLVRFLLLGSLVSSFLFSCGKSKSASTQDEVLNDSIVLADSASIDSLRSVDNAPSEDETEALVDSAKEVTPAPVNRTGLHIYISKPTMHLFVVNGNDSVVFSCGIACGIRKGDKTGKGDYRTPEGDFSISGMFNSTDWIHRTRDGRAVKGCYGPRFLRLRTGRFSGIGIHGTNAPGSIGRRASEGCIRVNSANIMTILITMPMKVCRWLFQAKMHRCRPLKGSLKLYVVRMQNSLPQRRLKHLSLKKKRL